MIIDIWNSGRLLAKYIGVDCSSGRDYEFLYSSLPELTFFVDIPCNHKVYLEEPIIKVTEYSGRGRKPFLLHPSIQSVTVASITANDKIPWQEVVLGTGSK
jgi:hypothetical protein